uniref:Major facilitator superfamily (MFS) profile domain-containing protein n=1 Tax=Acrobeloides nanus TaxID=290746 RepID=A0A914DZY2_9BILA
MQDMTKPLNSSPDTELNLDGTRAKTDWKSIYVLSIVTFLGAIQAGAVGPTVWPYMKLMDPSVPDTYSGYFRSINSLGHVISAVIAGYCCNRLNQTKTPMMTGKILIISASLIYLTIELLSSARRYVFVIFEFLMGFSLGFLMIGRVYVAMASTEKDRSRAVSVSTLAMPFGLALGPLFQIFFTLFGYPGHEFLFGTHLNVYTSPIYLSIFSCLIGITLLLLCFHGKLQPTKKADDAALPATENRLGVNLDKIAISICLLTKLMVGFVMICMMAIGPPYTMTIFGWTSANAVLYGSIIQGLIGTIGIGWNLIYMFTKLNHRLPERRAILLGFTLFLTFFLVTFPWPFYTSKIQYESKLNNSTSEPTGCNVNYKWCAETPSVNVWVYSIAQVLCMGFGMPLVTINLDILYSKILGPIKQGTMQGIFMVCGEVLNIAGPIAMSNVYTSSGPRYIWLAEMLVLSSGVILWVVFFRRMVSFSQKIAEPQKL